MTQQKQEALRMPSYCITDVHIIVVQVGTGPSSGGMHFVTCALAVHIAIKTSLLRSSMGFLKTVARKAPEVA